MKRFRQRLFTVLAGVSLLQCAACMPTAYILAQVPSSPVPQTLWQGGFGYDMGESPTYRNFYETFDKYPGYGIVEYGIDETYDPRRDLKHLGEAVYVCRVQLGAAWRSGTLVRIGDAPRPVPFTPRFVVIALSNEKNHTGAADFAASYRVAWLVPTADLFDESKDAKTLMAESIEDRHPFAFDMPADMNKGYSPNESYHWLIIERHMAAATQPATRELDH